MLGAPRRFRWTSPNKSTVVPIRLASVTSATTSLVSGIVSSSITPLIATTLLKANDGQPWYVAGYIFIVAMISAISTYFMRRTF